MVLSITLLRDYQETIKTSTEVIKETICDIRPPLYLLWGKPWGKMPINIDKPYPEVSVPFSALAKARTEAKCPCPCFYEFHN